MQLPYISPDLRPLAVPVCDLQPAPGNARQHRDRDVLALAESLHRFGQRKPIVAMRQYRGVAGAVIAGNGTLFAAHRLRWSHLAVSWFEGSEDEARAFAIADNRTAELSDWDLGALARDAAEFDLSAWFTPTDLANLLGSDAPVPDFQPAPESDQGRLDKLAPITCPHCGGAISREDLR